jgi:hypothetical protein
LFDLLDPGLSFVSTMAVMAPVKIMALVKVRGELIPCRS